MKKVYFMIFAICVTLNANAQLNINFDDMAAGFDVVGQDPNIVLWPAAGVTSSQVTTEIAFSGDNSIVTREQDGVNVDDILVNLGNKETGTWSISFMMYVPTGNTGFWNIQNDDTFGSTAEAQWNGQFFVGLTDSGGVAGFITFDQDPGLQVPYPSDEWFPVTHVIDMEEGLHTLDINGTLLLEDFEYRDTNANIADKIGAINFFAIDANNRYYVDDFVFSEGDLLNTANFDEDAFSVYPNPVQDVLNVNAKETVDTITVFDILGKQVVSVSPNTRNAQVDFSALASGAYFVRVTVNGVSDTVKVIK